jgi:hypothetical protein
MGQNAGLPYYQLPDGDLSNLGSLSSPRALSGIALGFGPLYGAAHQYALNALKFAQQNQGAQQRYTMQAIQANDPRNDAANFAYTAQQMQGQAADAGRYGAGQLRSMGLGKAAQAGAMLEAQNQARERQADMWAQLRNPGSLAQRYGANADALSFNALAGQGLAGASQSYQALMNALLNSEQLNTGQEGLKAQMDAQGGSLLGDLVGIAGSLGGFGGFKALFGSNKDEDQDGKGRGK